MGPHPRPEGRKILAIRGLPFTDTNIVLETMIDCTIEDGKITTVHRVIETSLVNVNDPVPAPRDPD